MSDQECGTEFVEAALRLIARGGLESVSVRAVATEAGRSAGALQKAFATKEELLATAVRVMSDRVAARLAGVEWSGDPVAVIVTLVAETLPLDARSRDEARVWYAIAGQAPRIAWMADVMKAQDRAVLAGLTAAVREFCPREPDPGSVASAVVALADGWALRLLYEPAAAPDVRRALGRAVTLLLGDGRRRPSTGKG